MTDTNNWMPFLLTTRTIDRLIWTSFSLHQLCDISIQTVAAAAAAEEGARVVATAGQEQNTQTTVNYLQLPRYQLNTYKE